MKKFLVVVVVLLTALIPRSLAEDDKAAIVAATKSYVAANSAITKINATVEAVEGDFARVKVEPQQTGATDPAWVFLKKTDGKWTGLVLGSSFTTEDYQQLGIPNALRIP
ncbi:MAG TPA: hypothetical protein VF511_08525 [Chthoniobacterales bacterium]